MHITKIRNTHKWCYTPL